MKVVRILRDDDLIGSMQDGEGAILSGKFLGEWAIFSSQTPRRKQMI
jgi:hypothetical protein